MSFPYTHPFLGLSNGLNTIHAAGGAVGGWVELGRTTNGSTTDPITVSSLADKRYYMVLSDAKLSGSVNNGVRLGNSTIDTGSNYSSRESANGGADNTRVSQSGIYWNLNKINEFNVVYFANLSGKEKLNICHGVGQNTAGAGTAPQRHETVGKWTNTSNPLDIVSLTDLGGTGSYLSGSEVVVLGWDPSDTHTNNFWEELASVDLGVAGDTLDSGTITAKKYLWFQVYTEGANTELQFRFNSDSGSNYASRRSGDGGADSTFTSQTQSKINATGGASHTATFMNAFVVNNTSNEKLCISHQVAVEVTGAGTAPRRSEGVTKWANTSNQITSVQGINNGAGDFGSGSKIRVWGAD